VRLAVFGGTFDPPHIAHVIHAQAAAEQLGVERVLFIPAADPPHKRGETRTSADHRVAMTELAIADNAAFALSRLDVDRPGPHYSVDMLRLVHEKFAPTELFFLIGADSLIDLPRWYQPQALITLCQLAVIPRLNIAPNMNVLQQSIPALETRVTFIQSPPIDISSTDIVTRVRAGKAIRYLVADAVLTYIQAHQLYEHNTTN